MKLRPRRSASVAVGVAAASLAVALLAGLAHQPGPVAMTKSHGHATARTHVMPGGSVMKDSQMPGMEMPTSQGKPSRAAAMICSPETAGAVQRTFAVEQRPVGLEAFADELYRCTYQLAGGDLRLSVKDLSAVGPGQAYFNQLKADLKPVQSIVGMANFGFPAFQTPRGDVVIIKDHKTLWVDASRVADSDLRKGATRTEAAYAVAAAVVACWTE
jgi:hypothetical protein